MTATATSIASPASSQRKKTTARVIWYVAGRIGQAILVLWLTYTIVFVAIQLLPSDPITIFLSTDAPADPELVERLRSHYGYDLPWYEQYVRQLANLARGELGFSISTGQPVLVRIGEVVGSTLLLATTALVFGVLFSVAVAAGAYLVRASRLNALIVAIPSVLAAVPVFWLGIIVLIVFSFQLQILPLFPDGSLISLLIPAAVLAIPVSAPLMQVLLTSVRESGTLPFVQTARAKGLSPRRVFVHHVLRASLAPAVAVLGIVIGALVAGSVITETVFSRPGLGNVLLKGVIAQDVPLVQGLVILTTLVVVLTALVIDLLLPALDPRMLRGGDLTGVGRLGS